MNEEQLLNSLKQIGVENLKHTLVDLNDKLVPQALDLLSVKIPGSVDDALIAVIKPVLHEILKDLIGKIEA